MSTAKVNKESKKRRWRVSRRGFLIGLGATGVGLALGVRFGVPAFRLQVAGMFAGENTMGGIEAPPNLWFEIGADNKVVMYMPKVEMGQGVHTALAQIAAEELEVAWEQVEVRQAPTDHGWGNDGGTAGSTSVSGLYGPLREAGATMRQMLLSAAAGQLGVAVSGLEAKEGAVYKRGESEPSLSYGEIAANVDSWEVPEEAPALKSVADFHTIGQAKGRVDFASKLTGEAIYGYDMRLPGMLYGAVARPPSWGSRLVKADVGTANEVDGVEMVVLEDGWAGVVATSRAAAQTAIRRLDLSWEEDIFQQEDIDEIVQVGNGRGVVIQKEGDVKAAFEAEDSYIAEYSSPVAVHAHLEGQAALVDVQADKVKAWVSTQFPSNTANAIAEFLGREPETVVVQGTYLGGGFGRKEGADVALEAARLSAKVGKPVHVGWTRTEEMRYGYFRPPTRHVMRGRVAADGKLLAMEHQQVSGPVAFGFVPKAMELVLGADFGAWRGAMIPYAIADKRTMTWLVELPFRTGWWRGLGLLANVFAVESFVDELAHQEGIDPLTLRLNNLPEGELGERYRRALEAVAEGVKWAEGPPAGRGRGLAICVDANTVVAMVADVAIVDNQIKVERIVTSVDPGLVINPDGCKAQTEGGILMGLSSTLFEEIRFKDGQAEAGNFDSYPLLTMKETPDVEVLLLSSGDRPFGMGEPPMGPVAAAVANAVFDLTGQRLRHLPLRL
ncbi:MAG TPA: molybdopterin cofactor-binding domain-containing protein [Anaerolineae bacterium]|nr:molybdopterin cofactor-binding domain-containing protein [Anaerolineae bacterium]